MTLDKKTAGMFVLLALFLLGMEGAGDSEDERVKLLEQSLQLSVRVETLKRELDLLVFQKEALVFDSKYLILDSGTGAGKLKYKNRILKNFSFSTLRGGGLDQGKRVLTEKLDGAESKHRLFFGKTLVLAPKGSTALPREKHKTRILLARKDFLSIYYALENGALMYIVKSPVP